jgi:hypothetical protein
MKKLLFLLNLLSGLAALLAAFYWYKPAALPLPNPVTHWDATPDSDPFGRGTCAEHGGLARSMLYLDRPHAASSIF